MKCHFCGNEDTKVTDSRNSPESSIIRRRRECLGCSKRFTTIESIDLSLQVQKRDGSYEEFQIEKIIKGLASACLHTRISYAQVLDLASAITHEILDKQIKELQTLWIGEVVMEKLKKLDTVAYIRFACVYRRFKDKDEIIHAIEE